MAKASKSYTGGKRAVGTPTLGKEIMYQLIRKCRDANGKCKHDYTANLRRNIGAAN